MSALTLQVASDLIAAHIGFVTGSIDREPAMQFRPLAKLPEVFNGVNAQADALEIGNQRLVSGRTPFGGVIERRKPEISTGHPTQPTRTDAQPSRAVSPNPATIQHGGTAAKGIQR